MLRSQVRFLLPPLVSFSQVRGSFVGALRTGKVTALEDSIARVCTVFPLDGKGHHHCGGGRSQHLELKAVQPPLLALIPGSANWVVRAFPSGEAKTRASLLDVASHDERRSCPVNQRSIRRGHRTRAVPFGSTGPLFDRRCPRRAEVSTPTIRFEKSMVPPRSPAHSPHLRPWSAAVDHRRGVRAAAPASRWRVYGSRD